MFLFIFIYFLLYLDFSGFIYQISQDNIICKTSLILLLSIFPDVHFISEKKTHLLKKSLLNLINLTHTLINIHVMCSYIYKFTGDLILEIEVSHSLYASLITSSFLDHSESSVHFISLCKHCFID